MSKAKKCLLVCLISAFALALSLSVINFTASTAKAEQAPSLNTSIQPADSPAPLAESVFGKNGGTTYSTQEEFFAALSAASSGEFIITQKGEYTVDSITVPANVTLTVPYNEAGNYTGDGGPLANAFGWSDSATYQYISLTVSGAFTVNGTVRIGGVHGYPGQSPMQCHTSGAYSHLILNGTATVENGGTMDVRGLVTGSANLEVKDGGKLYHPFVVLDYMGGTLTVGFYDNNKESPFKRYSMPNIQCTGGITVKHGGQMYGHVSLYTDKKSIIPASYNNADVLLIASSGAMINLENEQSEITVIYSPTQNNVTSTNVNNTSVVGRTDMTLKGGATLSGMKIIIKVVVISVTVDTAEVLFPVPYNFHINFTDGEYNLSVPYKLLPGATAVVESGAILNVQNRLAVLDGMEQGTIASRTYPTAAQLKAANLTSNAQLTVNGTLNILPSAAFTGVVQTTDTTGAAKIVTGAGAVLAEKITDGCRGGSAKGLSNSDDCNYFEITTSARVWDKAHNAIVTLAADRTYLSDGDDTFTLPSDSQSAKKETVTPHESAEHTLGNVTIAEVTGLKGSWKVKHDGIDHSYDWTLKDNEKPDESNRVKTVTKQCAEVGCTETHTKTVLYVPESLGAVTFKNAAYTQEEIKAQLFDVYFGTSFADGFSAELSLVGDDHTAAGVHQAKVTLTEGYFNGESLEEEHTFNYTVSPYEIKQNEAAVNGTSFVFKNEQWQPTVTVTVNGKVLGDGEYEISGYGENIHVGDGTVTVKGTGNYSGEVTLTFQITAKSAKVTVLGTGVKQGDTPKAPYNITIEDFLGEYNDKDKIYGMLDFDIAAPDQQTAGNSFTVTPKLKAGQSLDDYTVQWVAGTFTIYDYAGIDFSGDTNVTYDGYEHALTVTGLDDGDNAVLTYTKTDGGVGSTEAPTEAGTYTVTATVTFGDGREEHTLQTTLNIAKRSISEAQVTVNVPEGGYSYNRESFTPEVTVTLTGLKEGVVVTFEKSYDKNNVAGTATVTLTGTGNFTDSATGSFEISKAKITVNIAPKTSEYGEDLAPLTFDYTGVYEGDSIDVESKVSLSTTATKFSSVDGSYTISATITNDLANYEIVAADAAYTLTARNITVTIQNQNAAFSNSAPAVVQNMYSVSENGIVNDDDLAITLTAAFNGNYGHGEYTISGVCGNQNYNVSWVEGSFTIDKLDIGDTLSLYIEGATDGENNTLNATYKGEALALVGLATSDLEAGKHINVVCSPAEIDSLGTVQVTLTIEEDNYCGEKQITVIVTDEKGYNNDIREALRDLEVLTQGIDVNNLTEADFAKLKQARQRIDQLSEEDRELAASDLQKYEDMIAGWNNSNSVPDEVIETAKAVADAPVAGLFVTINAALALAYVVSKGVKLL